MLHSSKPTTYKGYTIYPYKVTGEGGWNGWYAPIYNANGDQLTGYESNPESPFDALHKKEVVEQAKRLIDSTKWELPTPASTEQFVLRIGSPGKKVEVALDD